MEFDADHYYETNLMPRLNGKELMDRISSENTSRKFDTVLDIGCGPGNVTKELLKELDVRHIYAADVDEDMLAIAKHKNPNDKITYLLQDFNKDWDHLTTELRALEDKVSLIFSNFAINWIRDKSNLVANMHRFLAKGGKVYVNILGVSDPYVDLTPEERVTHEREFLNIPSLEDQMKVWTTLFKNQGFTIKNSKIIEKTMPYYKEDTWPILVSAKWIYLVKNDKQSFKEVQGQLFDKSVSQLNKYFDKNGKLVVDLKYQYFQIVLEK